MGRAVVDVVTLARTQWGCEYEPECVVVLVVVGLLVVVVVVVVLLVVVVLGVVVVVVVVVTVGLLVVAVGGVTLKIFRSVYGSRGGRISREIV